MYYCKNPKVKNTNLESIEHHCRFADPDHHEAEIMKSFQESNCISSANMQFRVMLSFFQTSSGTVPDGIT
jgi:hypothetical protein